MERSTVENTEPFTPHAVDLAMRALAEQFKSEADILVSFLPHDNSRGGALITSAGPVRAAVLITMAMGNMVHAYTKGGNLAEAAFWNRTAMMIHRHMKINVPPTGVQDAVQ